MLVEIHAIIAASGYLVVINGKRVMSSSSSLYHRLIASEHAEIEAAHVHAHAVVGVHP